MLCRGDPDREEQPLIGFGEFSKPFFNFGEFSKLATHRQEQPYLPEERGRGYRLWRILQRREKPSQYNALLGEFSQRSKRARGSRPDPESSNPETCGEFSVGFIMIRFREEQHPPPPEERLRFRICPGSGSRDPRRAFSGIQRAVELTA